MAIKNNFFTKMVNNFGVLMHQVNFEVGQFKLSFFSKVYYYGEKTMKPCFIFGTPLTRCMAIGIL